MTVKLLIEHHLEFLSLKGGITGSSEPTLVKMPHCWKSYVADHMLTQVSLDKMQNIYTLMRKSSKSQGKAF